MFGGVFDADSVYKKIADQEALTAAPGFWDDSQKATGVMNRIKRLKNTVEPWKDLKSQIEDIEALYELSAEEGDQSQEGEIRAQIDDTRKKFEHESRMSLLSGEVDGSSAFLSVHAGAGGTEAEDWAFMLSRMYSRWAERRGFKLETVDVLEAEGGIKSVTFQIDGDYVYGYLKGEAGIHRLVRISPFDANARRHTSFASVYVFPILDDTIEVKIDPKDLRVDTYRSGGKGGQHVNKTESAVRFTHLPTGIVVACDSERSQLMNRATAMSILKSKLYQYYKEQKEKENSKYNAEKKDISWGNQIRSYVFQPYTMVKDLRTRAETGNIQAVMDGDIDQFIETYLNAQWKGLPLEAEDEGDDQE